MNFLEARAVYFFNLLGQCASRAKFIYDIKLSLCFGRGLLLGFLLLCACASAETSILDEIEGVYVVKEKATAQKERGGSFVAVAKATDCLVIRLMGDAYEIYLSTIQTRGSACYVEGRLVLKGGKLVVMDEDVNGALVFTGVELNVSADEIRPLRASRVLLTECGPSADLEAVWFSRRYKIRPWAVKPAKQLLELRKYCPAWNQ